MPYGNIKPGMKETPAMTAKMERCVKSVQASNKKYSKGQCIAICKFTIAKSLKKKK